MSMSRLALHCLSECLSEHGLEKSIYSRATTAAHLSVSTPLSLLHV